MAAYIVDGKNMLIGITMFANANEFNIYNVSNSETKALTKREYYAIRRAKANEDH